MTEAESYHFDVSGFLVVHGALSAAELDVLNAAIERTTGGGDDLPPAAAFRYPFLQLRDHPVLVAYVRSLCGDGYRLDNGPQLLGDKYGSTRLEGGGEFLDWSRAYFHRNGVRHCQGLTAVYALSPVAQGDGGLALIPASHRANVEIPEEVLDEVADAGLVKQPSLQPGDLLLCASSLVHGMREWRGDGPLRLLRYDFTSRYVRTRDWGNLDAVQRRPWFDELTPAQQAVLHDPQRRGEPTVVRASDGSPDPTVERGVHHPSIYVRNTTGEIDAREFYHWDLCGHLVLKEVMDADWIAAANAAIEAHADRIEEIGGIDERDSRRLQGSQRARLAEAWSLPTPYGEPFRRMIAHPEVISRMNWMMGSGFEATKCEVFCSRPGGSGHLLHGGGDTESETNHYTFRNGRSYCEYVNVAWQLGAVTEADGGFCCVPGSHKTSSPMPAGVRSGDTDMEMISHVAMAAGDVLFFLAGAQTHGALPWKGQDRRGCVLLQYRSRNLSWEYAAQRHRYA